ncbi:Serine/threonine-protein kinase SAPK5 [Taenia solium]|eukprot:TsM_000386900 transcript=TsM_000386900 gene=TsM_000386900
MPTRPLNLNPSAPNIVIECKHKAHSQQPEHRICVTLVNGGQTVTVASTKRKNHENLIRVQSLRIYGPLAFVMHKSSDVDLFTLAHHLDDVPEDDAQLHACKIICGLQRLYAMRTVHMDLKPEDIPLPD